MNRRFNLWRYQQVFHLLCRRLPELILFQVSMLVDSFNGNYFIPRHLAEYLMISLLFQSAIPKTITKNCGRN
jgi:hypothetical protein